MRKHRHKKQGLVTNVTAPTEKQEIVTLTLNLLPKACRVDNLEGQEYTVIPMVILTEGVHAGSMGPLYYPKDELAKTPQCWNHKPIVVYHPTMNGVGVSACDPIVINSRKVGLMMNTKFQGGKLKSEAWIRKDRAETVDNRIMAAVNSGEMMELSTGVFVDVEETDGTYYGEEYGGIARNYRPDHLALLPDQIGACSIADGAGFLRNQAMKSEADGKHPASHYLVVQDAAESSSWHLRVRGKDGKPDHRLMGAAWAALHKGFRGNKYSGPAKESALKKLKGLYNAEELALPTDNELLADNELSFDAIRSALYMELQERFPQPMIPGDTYAQSPCYIEGVYSNFFIFEKNGTLYRLGYTANDTDVELSEDEPVEVVRVSEYRTVENQIENIMDKELKTLVDSIIGNATWTKEDQDKLGKLPKEQLQTLAALKKADPNFQVTLSSTNPAKASDNLPQPAAVLTLTPASVSAPVPATNQQIGGASSKPVTVNDYIAAAPREFQEVLNNSMAVYNEEKAGLVAAIAANENNAFTPEELNARALPELRKMARLMGAKPQAAAEGRAASYAGQAPVADNSTQEEALVMPTINFDRKTA